ncbi:MAG: hypothetical protein AB8E87_00990 [Prochlorococcus sp.]|nr:hypothetical protein [Prochlorococcaceae cyanobacterium Fu_MAG_50]
MSRVSIGAVASGWLAALGMSVLVVILQGCESTPYGKKLSDSFDSPQQGSAAAPGEAAAAGSASTGSASTGSAASRKDPGDARTEEESRLDSDTGGKPQQPEQAVPRREPKPDAAESDKPAVVQSSRTVKTQPYRIIIKLSGADPSAPAEAVTEALRKAGVLFEVETIERVKPSAPGRLAPAAAGDQP